MSKTPKERIPIQVGARIVEAAGLPLPPEMAGTLPLSAVAGVDIETVPLPGVREDREAVYGDPALMMREVATHWNALLQSHYQEREITPIPPHFVGLFMAALKLHRIAAPFDKKDDDSYVDLKGYLDFAEENDPTLPARIVPIPESDQTDAKPETRGGANCRCSLGQGTSEVRTDP